MKTRLILALLALCVATQLVAGEDPSYSEQVKIDTIPFFPGGTYDRAIPHPNEFLQYKLGQWPLRYHELVPYLKAIAAASDRVKLEPHAVTHEGRQLYNVFISSPEHIRNLESLRQSMDKLADPNAGISQAERDRLSKELPAFAWLGYSVHGDEVSGVDAAAQLIYQLAAGTDSLTERLLNDLVIIVDPIQNPDGRERYLSMLQTYKSSVPNYNPRAMQHQGVWPWGRANHYLFDMNRDWILLTQPETYGKVTTIQKWHPQMVVDAHEMGSEATYLFSPPREPINYNITGNTRKWADVFSADQAHAFDNRGWTYYVGEWHEQWYPGYASAWPSYFGSIAILYEQAGVDGQFVRQPDNYLLTYHQAVNQQFTSSLTNLRTLADNREAILRDYAKERADIVARGRKSGLTFLFAPDRDEVKMQRFIDRLVMQGIEVQEATEAFTATATDIYGDVHRGKQFPKGTFIVSTAQVNGALAKAILEFDPKLKLSFLKEERRELEKHNDSRMYEVSTWSLPLAYDVEAYSTTSRFNVATEPVTNIAVSAGKLHNQDATVGFVVDMVGEKTYQMLTRLFEKEVIVHAAEKPFTIEGRRYAAGALFVRKRGNADSLVTVLSKLAEDVGIDVYGVSTGASSEGSYLGAPTFELLTRPKVALISGDGLSFTDVGSLWFLIDKELKYPHSLVNLNSLRYTPLDQYNVIILPGSWGPLTQRLGKGGAKNLGDWVANGGTLICMGSSAVWAADSSSGLSQVALMRQMLDKLDAYKKAAEREARAEAPEVDTVALWHPDKLPPEEKKKEEKPGGKLDKDADEWNRRFFPRGVIMRADLDTEDWLAFGMRKSVPVMLYTTHAFLAKPPVKTVARFADGNHVRLSGLLWPEARERWAGSAYCTRERKGSGQIIMFASHPDQRAYFYGTRKMFVNAVLYGPGMGTRFESPYQSETKQ